MRYVLTACLILATAPASAQVNPYGGNSNSPRVYGSDGKYLGNLNSNQYDPNSVSNPYGRYGSQYSPDSINNPYGRYGNPYFPNSVTNPYGR